MIKLWLWDIQIKSIVHEGDSILAIVLFCKNEIGETISVVVDDWKSWIRLLNIKSNREPSDILEPFKSKLLSNYGGFCTRIVTEEPVRKLYGWEPISDTNLGSKLYPNCKLYLRNQFSFSKLKSFLENIKYENKPILETLLITDFLQQPKTRFLNDTLLSPCSWFSFDLNESRLVSEDEKLTTSKEEYYVSYKNLKPFECSDIPPIKVLSFDCEMSSFNTLFPSPYKGDTIFCLSSTISYFSSLKQDEYKYISLYLGDCEEKQTDSHVIKKFLCFRDLAEYWQSVIQEEDPDIVTGWNIDGFDFDYFASQYNLLFKDVSQRCNEDILSLVDPSFLKLETLISKLSFVQKNHLLKMKTNEIKWKNRFHILKPLLFSSNSESLFQDEDDEEIITSKNTLYHDEYLDLRSSILMLLNLESQLHVDLNKKKLITEKFGRDVWNLLTTETSYDSKKAFCLSRFRNEICELESKSSFTAQRGHTMIRRIPMKGRIVLDMMKVIKDELKPASNALKYASQKWLSEDSMKIDLSTEELFSIYKFNLSDKASKVIEYCERDADIPIKLMFKLQFLTSWVGLSKVTHLPPDSVINSGQQQRVFSLLSRRISNSHAVNVEPSGWPDTPEYVGATVIDPDVGFFDKPISTLDFASLYPSIIGSNNLCFSTLVTNRSLLSKLKNENHENIYQDFTIEHPTKNGDLLIKKYAFVTHVRSVLADLLISLLTERKTVKKQMENAETPFLKEVLNKRQTAIKLVCNSVYGFTGVDVDKGLMSCKPIAAVTTLIGRKMIQLSKVFVETNFKGSTVIYGDTDSIMIHWNIDSLEQAFSLGEQASKDTTAYLRTILVGDQKSSSNLHKKDERDISNMVSIIKLEHEKEYWPYLLLKKKNYAGRKWTPISMNPLVMKDEIDIKGLQAVRRDTVPFISDLSKSILDALLIDKSEEKALDILKTTLQQVNSNQLPIEKFIMSKSLASNYVNGESLPHVSAWNRMKERQDSDPPSIGGRMPFVIVEGKSAILATRAEHPNFIKQNPSIKLDTSYYITATKNPILKILQFTNDTTIDEIFRDALNVSSSKNTHSLSDFMSDSNNGDDVMRIEKSPPRKLKKRIRETQTLLDYV